MYGERLNQRRTRPYRERKCPGDMMKWLGFFCLCLGTFSTAVVQRGIIRLEGYSNEALYNAIKPGGGMMGWASLAVVTMLMSSMAIPIYARLVYQGWQSTGNQGKYLLRLLGLAFVSEFCYDWAMSGTLLEPSRQNPVWALAIAVVMLSLLRQLERPGPVGIFLKVVVTVAAIAWSVLLQSYMGAMTVVLTACFYFLRERKKLCTAVAALLCLLQFPAPFGMIFVHYYDGSKAKAPRNLFYLLYPLQLVVFGLVGMVLGGLA